MFKKKLIVILENKLKKLRDDQSKQTDRMHSLNAYLNSIDENDSEELANVNLDLENISSILYGLSKKIESIKIKLANLQNSTDKPVKYHVKTKYLKYKTKLKKCDKDLIDIYEIYNENCALLERTTDKEQYKYIYKQNKFLRQSYLRIKKRIKNLNFNLDILKTNLAEDVEIIQSQLDKLKRDKRDLETKTNKLIDKASKISHIGSANDELVAEIKQQIEKNERKKQKIIASIDKLTKKLDYIKL